MCLTDSLWSQQNRCQECAWRSVPGSLGSLAGNWGTRTWGWSPGLLLAGVRGWLGQGARVLSFLESRLAGLFKELPQDERAGQTWSVSPPEHPHLYGPPGGAGGD